MRRCSLVVSAPCLFRMSNSTPYSAFEGTMTAQLYDIALTTTSRPSSAYYSEISAEIYTNAALVADGAKTAEQATADMTKNIQAILDR